MRPSVALASLPWAPVTEPSLALAILVAAARGSNIPAKALHLNTELLQDVTFDTYVAVAEYWGINEFVFTDSLSHGLDDWQLDALVDRCAAHLKNGREGLRYATVESLVDMLLRFRFDVAPAFLERCADKVLATEPTMFGLTCMFDQTLASVALAKIVKERSPETLIVLGGYAVQGPPGEQVLKAFPWIDGIARGDGEEAIIKLAQASVGDYPLNRIEGLLVRDQVPRPQRSTNLQNSPDPDYSDWFSDVETLKRDAQIEIVTGTLPVESSRGCWWGQSKHCVFCGIDDDTLRFRHKTADRTFDMLAGMRDRYGDLEFRFSDYILPIPYYDQLLPRLAEVERPYRLKCEIKANQSIERVRQLSRAGFREVQPGIESFSSGVLKLMDKGVSAIQNVALLKHGYVHDIVVHYNWLYGIPGETSEHYRDMRANLPRLYHLTPPVSRSEAIVTRFAPLHTDPARFGSTTQPVHHRCYDVLFSLETLAKSGFSLDDYAYYFERYLTFEDELSDIYKDCVTQINHWKRQHRDGEVRLDYEDSGECLVVLDSRFGPEREMRLEGLDRAVYLACDEAPVTLDRIRSTLDLNTDGSLAQIAAVITRLDEDRLIWREGEKILGLAVPRAVADRHLNSKWRTQWISIYR